MDWLGEEENNLHLVLQEVVRKLRMAIVWGWPSRLSLAGFNSFEVVTWADQWLARIRCHGLETIWSSKPTNIKVSRNRGSVRRPEDTCILSLGKAEFSRQALVLTAMCGIACGYALRRWIEPAAISIWQRVTKAAGVWWLETRIRMSRIYNFLAFWWRPARKDTPQTTRPTTRPPRSGSKQNLNRPSSITRNVDVVEAEGSAPIEAEVLRSRLKDGDLLCLTFDGDSYSLRCEPTFTLRTSQSRTEKARLLQRKGSGRNISAGRVIDDCSLALSSYTIYDQDHHAFHTASANYVNKTQRTRFDLALRHLQQIKFGCIAIFRLVRAPNEPTEPPRDGDLFIIWNPSDDPRRSLADRKATTPVVVNQLFAALTESRVLASFTFRAEAQAASELDYDHLYRKLFQVALVR